MPIFKEIPHVDSRYLACSDGNIYSDFRKNRVPLIACRGNKGEGYLQVSVIHKGKRKTMQVHTLICTAFNGEIPEEGMWVAHGNGDKDDNRPHNLRWDTPSGNHADKKSHGTDDKGFKNSRSKITEKEYLLIKQYLREGKLTHEQIGAIFKVNRVFITKINTGQRYNFND